MGQDAGRWTGRCRLRVIRLLARPCALVARRAGPPLWLVCRMVYSHTHIPRCRYARPAGGCIAGLIDTTTSDPSDLEPCLVQHFTCITTHLIHTAVVSSLSSYNSVQLFALSGVLVREWPPYTRTGAPSRGRVWQLTTIHCIHITSVIYTAQFHVVESLCIRGIDDT